MASFDDILNAIRERRLHLKKRIDDLVLTINGDTDWFLECITQKKEEDERQREEILNLKCKRKGKG